MESLFYFGHNGAYWIRERVLEMAVPRGGGVLLRRLARQLSTTQKSD